jgi:phosphonate transport system ATP-binding protein
MLSAYGLVADQLCKQFAGRVILSDISFSAQGGEFLAVVGPSGAGKTTLLRCLAGLTASDSGQVALNGVDVRQLKGQARRQIGVVFQQFNLVRRLTALENVLAGRLGYMPAWRGCLRWFERADMRLALECLEQVGLLAQAHQRADSLSGGQQQRVAIARILAQRPTLIIADEPVASLDPQNSVAIVNHLRQIARTQGAIVVCSLHQVQLAQMCADHVIGLAQGRQILTLPMTDFDAVAMARVYTQTESQLEGLV